VAQSVREYLSRYYINLDQLAELAGMRPSEVQSLIDEKLAPAPSYVVTAEGTLISCVFGEFDAPGVPEGNYFHREGYVWIRRAQEVRGRAEQERARSELRAQFKANFTQALREINDSLVPLPDTFSEAAEVSETRLNERFEEAWEALIEGVYSLCVADPSNEPSIARKEMLQEHLQRVHESIGTTHLSTVERSRVLNLIDQYAQAAMPFAPPEYPRSSRKRLVEDLAQKLRGE
jgi:uncharacterized protein DUF6058